MSTLSPETTVAASGDQVSSKVSDEEVILNLENGTYYGLNPVGARIWGLIQKPISVANVVEKLLEDYEVSQEQCLRDVIDLLSEMREEDLVEVVEQV